MEERGGAWDHEGPAKRRDVKTERMVRDEMVLHAARGWGAATSAGMGGGELVALGIPCRMDYGSMFITLWSGVWGCVEEPFRGPAGVSHWAGGADGMDCRACCRFREYGEEIAEILLELA